MGIMIYKFSKKILFSKTKVNEIVKVIEAVNGETLMKTS